MARAGWRKEQPVSEMERSEIELQGLSRPEGRKFWKILKMLDCIPVIYLNITPYKGGGMQEKDTEQY